MQLTRKYDYSDKEEILMPKVTIPTMCVKCSSEKFRREELAMGGRHGVVAGRGYRFDVYICEECGYSEFFFKERTLWV